MYRAFPDDTNDASVESVSSNGVERSSTCT